MEAGVLPVKRLGEAKSRLAACFDQPERAALARALLEDALALCQAVDFIEWWVVSDDEQVLREAHSRRLRVAPDPGTGLNAAVASALATILQAGAASATVLPVDVPLARREDLSALVATGSVADVVVVPAGRDGGTNALHLRPPSVITPCFGSDSLRRYVAEASRLGLRASILSLPRVALDIDTVEDVRAFVEAPGAQSTHTGRVLQGLRAIGRLV